MDIGNSPVKKLLERSIKWRDWSWDKSGIAPVRPEWLKLSSAKEEQLRRSSGKPLLMSL